MISLRRDRRYGAPGARRGFTLVELLFVVLIAGILGTLAFPRFSHYLQLRALINAQNAVGLSAARARAAAVERGEVVLLVLRPSADRVLILGADGAVTLDDLNLATGEIQADLIGEDLVVCYTPRGFAHPGCGDGDELPQRIGFGNYADTLWSVINAVGQVQKQ